MDYNMSGRISYYGGIVKDGLVFYLDAAKNESYPKTGTIWNDISGNQNRGILVNGPTFNSNNGGSIVFDGTNDYVIYSASSFTIGTSPVTLSVWTRISTLSNWFGISLACGIGSPNRFIWCGYVLTAQYGTSNMLGGGGYGQNIGTDIPPDDKWHNITTISNGGSTPTVSIYIDGVFKISANIILDISSNVVKVGAGDDGISNSVAYALIGDVSNAVIYNRALSATEVLQNYNAIKGRYGL